MKSNLSPLRTKLFGEGVQGFRGPGSGGRASGVGFRGIGLGVRFWGQAEGLSWGLPPQNRFMCQI